jgi:molecular chaperone DnaK (HSP70)
VLRIVNEPTAAAMAYSFALSPPRDLENLIVFDFGDGILDVSLLSIIEKKLKIKAVDDDTTLG